MGIVSRFYTFWRADRIKQGDVPVGSVVVSPVGLGAGGLGLVMYRLGKTGSAC